jgi:glycine/D-amino acid oxidase-like deaminating enzyme
VTGALSRTALRGLELPVFPVKGCSITLPPDSESVAPQARLTDEAHKLVLSRLGHRLRVAGTAEVAGYDNTLDEHRLRAALLVSGLIAGEASGSGDCTLQASPAARSVGAQPFLRAGVRCGARRLITSANSFGLAPTMLPLSM